MKAIYIQIEELKGGKFSVVLNNLSREDATLKEQTIADFFEELYLANVHVLNPISTELIKGKKQ